MSEATGGERVEPWDGEYCIEGCGARATHLRLIGVSSVPEALRQRAGSETAEVYALVCEHHWRVTQT